MTAETPQEWITRLQTERDEARAQVKAALLERDRAVEEAASLRARMQEGFAREAELAVEEAGRLRGELHAARTALGAVTEAGWRVVDCAPKDRRTWLANLREALEGLPSSAGGAAPAETGGGNDPLYLGFVRESIEKGDRCGNCGWLYGRASEVNDCPGCKDLARAMALAESAEHVDGTPPAPPEGKEPAP